MNKINKTVEQNFPQQALDHQAFNRALLNDADASMTCRAVAAMKILEEEFIRRREFARDNGNTVHFERACKKLLEIRAAMTLIEFGLDYVPANKTTPSKIVVE